jgi:hypothetical protein
MKTTITAITAFIALSAIASTATADDLVVQTRITTAYYNDTSFDALSEYNAKSDFTLAAAWELQRMLRFGLQFQTAPRLTTSRFGGDSYHEWGRQKILATGEWGFYPAQWLRPHVQLGVGYVHQFLSVESTGPRLKDHAHDLGGFAALGVEAGIPVRWGRIGLATSLGYELQTTARFDELRHDRKAFEAKYEPDDDPWDRAHADFGSLETNGVFWTVGLSVSFGL